MKSQLFLENLRFLQIPLSELIKYVPKEKEAVNMREQQIATLIGLGIDYE